ncbi:GumC family protein [Rhizobium rhododendri]|uniref:GumC family protein n=1 Tax=Rhizobium rhododendri TaxID=2506430 RepID=A0ABY8IP13_9HYPH|nr:GumC family protein [Rhizobium rhododendri]WFS25206.1 GumC family protein [Rhizobium rhododendri]
MNDEAAPVRRKEQSSDPDGGLLDLRQLLDLIWLRRLTVGAAFGLCLLGGIAYIGLTPATYVAETVLLINPRQSTTDPSNPVVGGAGMDAATVESQVEVIGSRQLLLPLFRDLKLAQDGEFSDRGLISKLISSSTTKPTSEEVAYNAFIKGLTVSRRGLTYILTVDFKSKNAEKSALLANAVANQYIAKQISKKKSNAKEVTSDLEGRLGELRSGVDSAERAVEDFKVSQGYVNVNDGPALSESELVQASQQLSAATSVAAAAEARFQQLKSASRNADFTAVDSVTGSQLRTLYNAKSSELDRMESTLGERHPTLQGLRMELDGLRRQMQAEVQRAVGSAKLESDVANRNVATLNAKVDALTKEMNRTRQSEVTIRALQREADARRKVLEEYLQRSRETGEQQTTARADAEILSAAVPPTAASWPKIPAILGVAGFIGLAIGITLALLQGRPRQAPVKVEIKPSRQQTAEPPRPSLLDYLPNPDSGAQRSAGNRRALGDRPL